MYQVLIASTIGSISSSLADALRTDHIVHICDCGDVAVDIIDSIKPEVLITDINLPYMDVLTVLRHTSFRPPAIVAFATYVSPAIAHAAASYGIGRIIMRPNSVEVILSCTYDLIEEKLHNKIPSLDH